MDHLERPSPSADPASSARSRDRRRELARVGEDMAAAHLVRLGFAVLARNVRTRRGEIDLIACDGRTLAFVEVKTRRAHSRRPGRTDAIEPLEGLRPRQRARLRTLAAAWLFDARRPATSAHTIRFDAIGVLLDAHQELIRLEHLEGAW